MEWNQQTAQFLSQCFHDTLSPQSKPSRRAERNLSEAADTTANYVLSVLRLIAEPSVDQQIRQCAAVNFTDHLKTRWVPSSVTTPIIPDDEKKQIMTLLVPLMLSASPKIQGQLSEALAVIGNHDFLMLLSASLPELKSSSETAINVNDFASVYSILSVVNVMCKPCGDQCKSSPELDFKHCLGNFCALLLSTAEKISMEINAAAAGFSATLCLLIEAQRICFRILCVLNLLDVRVFSEENADKWINEFKNYFTMRYQTIEVGGADDLSLVGELQAAVLESIHYKEKGEKLFQRYLKEFVEDVRSLLVKASTSPAVMG